MSLTRVARTATATIGHQFVVGETAVQASGPVGYSVTDPAGTEVASGTADFDAAGVTYSFVLPAQAQLTLLTVAWSGSTGGATVTETGQVEIVGGFLFTLKQGRESDASLSDTNRYTTADLIDKRLAVELECEWICDQAWVPRYRRVVLSGTGTRDLLLPDGGDTDRSGVLMRGVRTIRSATIAPRFGQTPVALTAQQLAAVAVLADGTARRTDNQAWTAGDNNIIVEYEYGSDHAPQEVLDAALTRFRSRLQLGKSQIPDRAVSYTIGEQGTYRLALPDEYRTGLPDVDASYGRYSRRVSATEAPGRAAPASRTLSYDPQYYSIFHGGRR